VGPNRSLLQACTAATFHTREEAAAAAEKAARVRAVRRMLKGKSPLMHAPDEVRYRFFAPRYSLARLMDPWAHCFYPASPLGVWPELRHVEAWVRRSEAAHVERVRVFCGVGAEWRGGARYADVPPTDEQVFWAELKVEQCIALRRLKRRWAVTGPSGI